MNLVNKKKVKNLWLVISILLVVVMVIGAYDSHKTHQEYLRCENEYHTIHDRYVSIMDKIDEQLDIIDGFQYDLQCSSEELYFSMVDFYNNSTDEVFRYVFDERFPNRYDFYQNPSEFYVVMTALKENYPDLKNDEQVNKWSAEIETVTNNLHEAVSTYTGLVKDYTDTIIELNNCKYVKMRPKFKVTKKNYKEIIIE